MIEVVGSFDVSYYETYKKLESFVGKLRKFDRLVYINTSFKYISLGEKHKEVCELLYDRYPEIYAEAKQMDAWVGYGSFPEFRNLHDLLEWTKKHFDKIAKCMEEVYGGG